MRKGAFAVGETRITPEWQRAPETSGDPDHRQPDPSSVSSGRRAHSARTLRNELLEGSPDGIVILNRDYDILYANPAARAAHGALDGRKCHEQFQGSAQPCPGCCLPEVLADATFRRLRRSAKNGHTYDLLMMPEPYYGDGGENGVLVSFRDVTPAQEAEDALRKQTRLLTDLLDNIPHFVFWKDRDLNFLGCNRRFAESAGFESPRAIVGKSDYDLAWTREQSEWYRKCDREVMERGEPLLNIEETQQSADGTDRTVLTSKVPLVDDTGNVLGVLGIYADITERTRADQKLRLLDAAVRSSSSGIVVTDRQGAIVWVNPAFTNMTGYSPEEALGMSPRLLSSGRQDREFYRLLWDTILSGKVWKGELINQRKDGSRYTEEMTISPVRDAGGDLTHFVAVKQDVTESRILQSQLVQAQKLESIGQLAAGIAHEINTPTQFIGDNIHFLQDAFTSLANLLDKYEGLAAALRAGTPVEATLTAVEAAVRAADIGYLRGEIVQAVSQSLEGVSRVSRIVGAMKDFSHPDADRKQAADLNKAIESTLIVARNEWKYVADVETDYDLDLPLVSCRVGDINQVVLNLLTNAAHAIAEVIGDNGDKGRIRVSTRFLDDRAEIRISDTGAGIPKEIRSKVFDHFFTTKPVGQGTGQGLAIAHRVVVKNHGGTIAFDSEVGRGTTFVIRLPIGESPDPKEEALARNR